MTNTFSVEFNTKKFYKKIGGELSNSYDLSKGNELDISFKPEIENNSELGLEKKNENKYFDIVLSKKHIENLVEINDELSDSIFLRFTLIEQDPNVFEFSVVRNSNGQTNVSHSFENFQTGNIFNIRIYKNNLIIYFSGKNVCTMDIKELVGQEKIYITLKASLSKKLVLNEFKVKTLLKIPKKFQKIFPLGNVVEEPLLKHFPKLRKLSNLNNYLNAWITGEENEKVNFISESFPIEPTEIYIYEEKQEKKLNSKYYTIPNSNMPIKIKLIWNKALNMCQKMFQGCSNIISIDLSNIDINCEKMDSMFEGCSKLETINLKNVQTSNVKNMSYMFSGCNNFKSLDLTNFDTSKVISMESMFKNCLSLVSLDLSNFKTPEISNIKSMFENCKELKFIDMENFSTENCKDIDNVFKKCENLDEINLFNYKGKDIFGSIPININLKICINEYSQIWNKENNLKKKNIQNKCRQKTNKQKRILDETYTNSIKIVINSSVKTAYFLYSNFHKLPDTIQLNDEESFTPTKTKITLTVNQNNIIVMSWNEPLTSCKNMFQWCDSIVSIDFSNFDTSLINNTVSMFSGCTSLESIKFTNFNFSKIQDMSGMFSSCYKLQSIDLSYFNSSFVQDMSYMFVDCISLNSINVKSFDTSNVNNISSMFSGCNNLINLDLLNFDTSNVINMDSMFAGCSKLESLYLSKFFTTNVKYINSMFANCSSLQRVDMNSFSLENIDENITNKNSIFENCNSIKYLSLINYKEEDIFVPISDNTDLSICINSYSQIAQGVNSLKTNNVPIICCIKPSSYNIDSKECQYDGEYNNITITINGNKGEEVSILYSEFEPLPDYIYINNDYTDYELLSSIELQQNEMNKIKLIWKKSFKSCENMFKGCDSILSIDLSNFNSSLINNSKSMFSSCSSLKSINFTNFNVSKIKDMSGMFSDCISLKEINVTLFDTSNVNNMSSMFSGCKILETLNISNFKTNELISMDSMFSNCSSLILIYMPDFVTSKVDKFDADSIFKESNNITYLDLFNYQDKDIFTSVASNENLEICIKSYSQIEGGKSSLEDKGVPIKCCQTPKKYNLNYRKCEEIIIITVNGTKGENVSILFNKFEYLPETVYIDDEYELKQVNLIRLPKDGENIIRIAWLHVLESCLNMFQLCDSIISIDLSYFNSSLINNSKSMFSGCRSLKSINFTNFDVSKIKDMSGMFSNCIKLESIDLSNFNNTSLVNDMGFMFADCISLKWPNIKLLDTSNVINMISMFSNCQSLTSLELNHFNTKSVIDMENMFSDCINLINLDLLYFDTTNVQNMNFMFSGCSKLNSLNLSSFFTTNVKNMNSMFSNCSSIMSIDMPNFSTLNFNTTTFNENSIFEGCKSLEYINLLNYESKDIFSSIFNYTNLVICIRDYEQIEHGNNSLVNNNVPIICCKLPTLYSIKKKKCIFQINDITVIVNGTQENQEITLLNKDFLPQPDYIYIGNERYNLNLDSKIILPKLGEVTIEMKWEELIEDCSYLFLNCNSLIYIDFSKFNSSIVNNTKGIFSGCNSLSSINFDNFDTSKVTNMEEMFKNCISLKNLNLSNFNTSSVEKMNSMFSHCSSLESINLTYLNTSNVINMNSMFANCTIINSLDLANFITSKVENMSEMFYGCNNLELMDLSNWKTSNVKEMEYMFYGCSSLKELNLSNFDTSSVVSMSSMFSGCTSLDSMDLFSFNTTNLNKFNQMFEGCNKLTYINLYDYIGKDIFQSIFNYTILTICIKSYEQINNGSNSLLENGIKNKCAISTSIITTLPIYSTLITTNIKTTILSYSTFIITSILTSTNPISSIPSTLITTNLIEGSNILSTYLTSTNPVIISITPEIKTSSIKRIIPSTISEISTSPAIKTIIPSSTIPKETTIIKTVIPSTIQEISTSPAIKTIIPSSTIPKETTIIKTVIPSTKQEISTSPAIKTTMPSSTILKETTIIKTVIPSTKQEISTSQLIITTIPTSTYKTTIITPLIETTIINPTSIKETSIIETIIPSTIQKKTTIPLLETTMQASTYIKEKETSIIKTTIPIFSTTYTSLINKETETPSETQLIATEKPTETEVIETEKSTEIEVINTTISDNEDITEAIEIQRSSAFVILLGYSDFIYSDINNIISFLIHFAILRGIVFSRYLKIIILIRYKQSLRILENINKEVNCELIKSQFNNQVKYNCSFISSGEEFELIKANYKFNFTEQDVEVISFSPNSIKDSENLLEIKNGDIFNKKLYILDNSTVTLFNNYYKLNFTGSMTDKSFNYNKIDLTVNIKNDVNKIINVSCLSIKLNEKNYTLTCDSKEIIEDEIISAFADLGKDNLLINILEEKKVIVDYRHSFITKKKSKTNIGIIIAIILSFFLIFIIFIIIYYYLKMIKRNKIHIIEDSSINGLNKVGNTSI